MSTTTSKGYGLQHKVTGELACLDKYETDGDGDHYILSVQKSAFHGGPFPEFEVETPEKAALARAINTPFYNSSEKRPSWGDLNMADYKVVELNRVCSVEVAPCDVPDTVRFNPPELTRKMLTRELAEQYLGRAIPPPFNEQSMGVILVKMPAGESIESLRTKCELRPVIFGPRDAHPARCLGVFEVPDDQAYLFESSQGVALITTYFDF
jgi:hypothetical protein